VSLPVTVDFERGYGLAPAELVCRRVGVLQVQPARPGRREPLAAR
jgi:2-methylisocitrate lyase-like PEP mutase family enzyme